MGYHKKFKLFQSAWQLIIADKQSPQLAETIIEYYRGRLVRALTKTVGSYLSLKCLEGQSEGKHCALVFLPWLNTRITYFVHRNLLLFNNLRRSRDRSINKDLCFLLIGNATRETHERANWSPMSSYFPIWPLRKRKDPGEEVDKRAEMGSSLARVSFHMLFPQIPSNTVEFRQ